MKTSQKSNAISGVYDYGRSTNFEAYLQELGVSYILRRLAGLASPTVTITRNQQTPCQVTLILRLLLIYY